LKVPGSGAQKVPYVEMTQALGNKGYDVTEAKKLIEEGM